MNERIRKKVLKHYYPAVHQVVMLSFIQGVNPDQVKVTKADGIAKHIVRNFRRIRHLVAVASRKNRNTLKVNELTKKIIQDTFNR